MTQNDPLPPDPIPYASPRPLRFSGIAPAVAVLAAGLGLVILGGCFLIGVIDVSDRLSDLNGTPAPLALEFLPWVLYAFSFGCFIGAAWLITIGVRWLQQASGR